MSNNDIDNDFDGEDFDTGGPAAPASGGMGGGSSIKQVWESSPLMKIAAVALGGIVLIGGYMTVFADDTEVDKSQVSINRNDTVKINPGEGEVDDEYRAAVEQQNRQQAEEAMATGTSALPTPIGAPTTTGLELPEAPTMQEDPLQEWRARAEAKRLEQQEQLMAPPEDLAPAPDVMPMVQPVRPQAQAQVDPQMATALAEQMRAIVAAQAPKESSVVGVTDRLSPFMRAEKEKEAKIQQAQLAGSSPNAQAGVAQMDAQKKVIVPAGNIAFAQLLNDLNSDVKGPVLAQVLSGPFQGGRALGQFSTQDEYLVLVFKRVVKDGVSYGMNGIALDQDTTLAGMQTDVDRHYFSRIILPAAAKFIEGYGQAVSETGTTSTVTGGGGVVQDKPEPDAKEELYKGVEEAASKAGEIFDENADRPITVRVKRGTTMGILFMDPVTTADTGK